MATHTHTHTHGVISWVMLLLKWCSPLLGPFVLPLPSLTWKIFPYMARNSTFGIVWTSPISGPDINGVFWRLILHGLYLNHDKSVGLKVHAPYLNLHHFVGVGRSPQGGPLRASHSLSPWARPPSRVSQPYLLSRTIRAMASHCDSIVGWYHNTCMFCHWHRFVSEKLCFWMYLYPWNKHLVLDKIHVL